MRFLFILIAGLMLSFAALCAWHPGLGNAAGWAFLGLAVFVLSHLDYPPNWRRP